MKQFNILKEFKKYPFLKKFTKIDDMSFNDTGQYSFYTSGVLVDNILKTFSDDIGTKTQIERLVKTGKIKIGFFEKGFVNFLKNRFDYFFGIKKIYHLGFYRIENDVIYICLDENVNLFGNEIFGIRETLMHELVHMSAKNVNNFEQITFPIYLNFFKNFMFEMIFFNMFHTNQSSINRMELKRKLSTGIFDNLLTMFLKRHLGISEKNSKSNTDERLVKNWAWFVKMFYYNLYGLELTPGEKSAVIKSVSEMYEMVYVEKPIRGNNMQISDIIKKSYKNTGISHINNRVGQEFKYMSEIAAVYFQYNSKSKMLKNLLKKI